MIKTRGFKMKIEWAKRHIRDLEGVIVPFFDGECCTVVTRLVPTISHYAVVLESIKPIPESIPFLIGDAIHNLRSALDHVAWELVEAGGGTPNKKTAFPICATAHQYKSAMGQGELSKIQAGAKQVMEATQPFVSNINTLSAIHELDIWDKHRVVLTVFAHLSAWGLKNPRIWLTDLGFGIPIETGDIVCHIPTDTWDRSKDNIRFGLYVAFGEPEIVKGKSVLETLHEMADFVDLVTKKFELFLT